MRIEDTKILTGGQAALRDAVRLVARAEQCGAGLSLKLQKKGYGKADVKAAVETLIEAGMVDDLRYACLWIESRIKHGAASPRRLLYGLCGKGLDRSTAETALKKTLDIDRELTLLRNFSEKHTGGKNFKENLRFEGFSAEALERMRDE
ncbi:MAG: recombination regulator RecX [Spirochaetaceae bacterium]|nr:recombination regulator RecX [Spirochaetaceae bacterium]